MTEDEKDQGLDEAEVEKQPEEDIPQDVSNNGEKEEASDSTPTEDGSKEDEETEEDKEPESDFDSCGPDADIRQPIVSVLGHVDHGKTSLLDWIRGSGVAKREAGLITQHIGATEVPLDTILEICGGMIKDKESLAIPGLLFIDTPGHHSFTSLRKRGGSLADIAILVVDVMEGIKPQTLESIKILKQYQTPFILAFNKIDRIQGWREHSDQSFLKSLSKQTSQVQETVDDKLYAIIERLDKQGFFAERYDRIKDFQRNIAIVPMSAKTGEGIADLVMVLIGLTQRFLKKKLLKEEGPAEGVVLEVKEEKGLGKTIDVIIHKGILCKSDTLVIGTLGEPIVSKIRAILRPKALDEIRDPREKFDSVKRVVAAAGIKITAPDLTGAIAGTPVRSAGSNLEAVVDEMRKESIISVDTVDSGVIVKADALGSIEAILFEMKDADIPVKMAQIGDVSRRDVIDAATISDPLNRAIFAFNVDVLPDAKDEIRTADTNLFQSDIIYKIIEDYQAWNEKRKAELESDSRGDIVYPGKFRVLPDCVFRVSKPAIVGVRILSGRIRQGQRILREDGRVIGSIKSIQIDACSEKEAKSGCEVAVSIDNVTVGRQLDVEDILYVDIPEMHAKKLSGMELNYDEREILDKVFEIKRKERQFWGM